MPLLILIIPSPSPLPKVAMRLKRLKMGITTNISKKRLLGLHFFATTFAQIENKA
jgi:hypothetical protein